MSDNLQDRGLADRSRINVNQDNELRYWSKKFGVTAEELKQAVKDVGASAKEVEISLAKKNSSKVRHANAN